MQMESKSRDACTGYQDSHTAYMIEKLAPTDDLRSNKWFKMINDPGDLLLFGFSFHCLCHSYIPWVTLHVSSLSRTDVVLMEEGQEEDDIDMFKFDSTKQEKTVEPVLKQGIAHP